LFGLLLGAGLTVYLFERSFNAVRQVQLQYYLAVNKALDQKGDPSVIPAPSNLLNLN
jgi:hypothetical protein